MKILIVSGFLGAGKTTFIRRLSRNIGKRFVILENEYGAAGIDGARLGKDVAEEGNIWEMTEQCICCSGKKDFASSVLTIANAVDPEYLIVEPTGVGRLSKIIENLKQIEYERIRLLSPVTIVDIYSFGRYLEEYPELYKDQIASAGTVIVSKTEQSGVEEKERIRKFIEKINSSAQIITDPYASMAREEFENFLKEEWGGGKIQKAETEEKLPDVFSLETGFPWKPLKSCSAFWRIWFVENMETSSEPKGSFKQARISSGSMWRTRATALPERRRKRPEKQSLLGN